MRLMLALPREGALSSPFTNSEPFRADDLLLIMVEEATREKFPDEDQPVPVDEVESDEDVTVSEGDGEGTHPFVRFVNARHLHQILEALEECARRFPQTPLCRSVDVLAGDLSAIPEGDMKALGKNIDAMLYGENPTDTDKRKTREALEVWNFGGLQFHNAISGKTESVPGTRNIRVYLLSDVIRLQRDVSSHALLLGYLARYTFVPIDKDKRKLPTQLRVDERDEYAGRRKGVSRAARDVLDGDGRLCIPPIRIDRDTEDLLHHQVDFLYNGRLGTCIKEVSSVASSLAPYVFEASWRGDWSHGRTGEDMAEAVDEVLSLLLEGLEESDESVRRDRLEVYGEVLSNAFLPRRDERPHRTGDGLRLEEVVSDYLIFEIWGYCIEGLLRRPQKGSLGICRYCRNVFEVAHGAQLYCGGSEGSCKKQASRARNTADAED